MGSACDSQDHRAGACYLPHGLMYDELRHAIGMCSLAVPPPHFEHALHLVNQGFHCSGAKFDVFQSLIDFHAGQKTQQLYVVGS